MKKLIILLMLTVTILSCSKDDTVNTTPFEGKWLVYKISTIIGDEKPSMDIWYVFNANAYTFKIDQEMKDYGIFTFETDLHNKNYHYINLNSNQYNRSDVYDAKFENGEILTLFDRDESTLFLKRVK